MKNTTEFDQDLNPILEIADDSDLQPLVEYLQQKYSEGLTSSEAYKLYAPNHNAYADLIAKEIREMGGNSIANTLRIFKGDSYTSKGPSYYEVVCDVANKLKAPYNKKQNIEEIEDSILATVLSSALEKMTSEEKEELLKSLGDKAGSINLGGLSSAALITLFRAGGFYSYQLTVIIANQVARTILGTGLTFATNATLTRVMSIVAGPIGLAVTGVWTAIDLAGPSFKVTIPSVIHIAMLRKKYNSINCPKCDAMITNYTAKFCSECGHQI